MQNILVWRLAIYSVIAIPCLALGWAWLGWWRQTGSSSTPTRRYLALMSIGALTVSAVTLLVFPEAIAMFAAKPLGPADEVYVRAIRLGFWAGLSGTIGALFAVRPMKARLLLAGALLIASWFLAGQSV